MISDIFEFLQYFIQYFNYLSNLEISLNGFREITFQFQEQIA